MTKIKIIGLLVVFFISFNGSLAKKSFTFQDAMNFKSVSGQKISPDGNWILYVANPDRGDGNLYIQSAHDTTKIIINRGSNGDFSDDSKWVAARILPKQLEVANAKSPSDAPKNSLSLTNLTSDKSIDIESVKSFKFTNDATWLVYQKFENKDDKSEKYKKKKIGSTLVLRHLNSGTEIPIENVTEYIIDSNSNYVFYTISSASGKRDGIYARNIKANFAPEIAINTAENTFFTSMTWLDKHGKLAYVTGSLRKDGTTDNGNVYYWLANNPGLKRIALNSEAIDKTYFIPSINRLQWTDDGEKLFFGYKPLSEKDTIANDDIKFSDSTFFNIDSILYNADNQVWHWKDDRIGTYQKKWWDENKDRTFTGIIDINKGTHLLLAFDSANAVNSIPYTDNSNFAIGYDEIKYSKLILYDGWYYDLYTINLATGEKKLIAEKIAEPAHISPKGSYIIFFQNKQWYVYNNINNTKTSLTAEIPTVFYDEDNDLPKAPDSYGIGGWYADERFVYIYDKYDIFQLAPAEPGTFVNFTAVVGRKHKVQFRFVKLDREKKYINSADTLFASGYYEKDRTYGIYFFETNIAGGINLNNNNVTDLSIKKDYTLLGRSKYTNNLIYSRENFDEFPDIWYGDLFLNTVKKLTDINPQMKDYIWGRTEAMQWTSALGDTIKGYLIKPDNYDAKKAYPVLVYFYERFSEYTNKFYQPRINHRPIYQTYLGDGYLVFVPDVIYRAGRPGQDAYDCIVPGLDSLIARGIIDKSKIVIQGHSWGGYQTAYLAATTNLFAAAAAGAPVGNMTSAYSQIRTESGLARQFQYEKWQSRIGGNLWDSLNSYLANSPVFRLKGETSPLLILHGNVDEAVPFAQGVELFLAYKRLNKPAVLVEYDKEPHHPRKYENKLDWQIKMKEWFDYFIYNRTEPKWISKGMPYQGK
ncbi:MAG TPA: prolyl oligopeptidase family serine peptidase [Candidatus Kapabacteria bacterium]|nr:prolyl oligopeptidase family serine peptidase [Candidatus Kapabacteria bacterium]